MLATLWSAIRPADYATWFFELFIGAAGVVALVALRHHFAFSGFLCGVVAAHYVVLARFHDRSLASQPSAGAGVPLPAGRSPAVPS